MYHGMIFDQSGSCHYAPAQTRIPTDAKVQSFPVEERHGFIWIWMGKSELADTSKIPFMPWLSSPDYRWKPMYLHYLSNMQLISDNTLDFTHLSFVHENSVGTPQQAEMKAPYIEVDGGLLSTRWDMDSDPIELHRLAGLSGKVDRWLISRWFTPGMLLLDAGSCPAGNGGPEGSREGGIGFKHTSIFTPETDFTTHYFWTHARDFKIDDDAFTELVHKKLEDAFLEDKFMIEAQQKVIRDLPDENYVGIAADSGPNMARRLMATKLEEEMDLDRAA
jgi:phenylpropionate dioxygenase-like ring-hydroxylating dioxygenase large terminal subunit